MKERKIKNILVTGGAGFIGSAFIRYLLTKTTFTGVCVNLDLLTYAGNLQNLKEIEANPQYVFAHGDIRNTALVEHLCAEHAIDTIIHFAAESHVDRSILGPQAFIETNIMGTFNLLEVVRKLPHIHFHHVSTDEVYGCLGETGFFTEETAYRPNSPYSASKASSDHIVRSYGKTYGLSTCISNCSNNFGPYHFPEKLIPLMILNAFERKALPIYGDGSNVRDWLYVEDHAAALFSLLESGRKGETYNIGGEEEWRNIDLVNLVISTIAEIQNVAVDELKSLLTYVKDRPGHDFRYAIDCSKIKNELGWKPTCSFRERIKETVLWYQNHSEWIANIQNGSYREWLSTNYSTR
jgi:dTDP-glucose 4,6-dehydratase